MTVNVVSQTIVKHDVSEIASLTRLTPEAGLSDPGGHRVNTKCALPPETSSPSWPERRWGSSSGSFPAPATLRSPPRRKITENSIHFALHLAGRFCYKLKRKFRSGLQITPRGSPRRRHKHFLLIPMYVKQRQNIGNSSFFAHRCPLPRPHRCEQRFLRHPETPKTRAPARFQGIWSFPRYSPHRSGRPHRRPKGNAVDRSLPKSRPRSSFTPLLDVWRL